MTDLMAVQLGEKLTDEHILAAQTMIQEEFRDLDGCQNCLLSQGEQFLAMVNEVMQIHHIKNHWVTSSSIGGASQFMTAPTVASCLLTSHTSWLGVQANGHSRKSRAHRATAVDTECSKHSTAGRKHKL